MNHNHQIHVNPFRLTNKEARTYHLGRGWIALWGHWELTTCVSKPSQSAEPWASWLGRGTPKPLLFHCPPGSSNCSIGSPLSCSPSPPIHRYSRIKTNLSNTESNALFCLSFVFCSWGLRLRIIFLLPWLKIVALDLSYNKLGGLLPAFMGARERERERNALSLWCEIEKDRHKRETWEERGERTFLWL